MDDLIARDAALKLELYELEAQRTERTLRWHQDGLSTPMAERAALDARIAAIQLERVKLRPQVVALRTKAHEDRASHLLAALIKQCRAAGMQALVDAARREAAGTGQAHGATIDPTTA